MSLNYSAIDIGSNAIRMIIAERQNEEFKVLKKLRSGVRLGQDVFQSGKLTQEIMHKALETFLEFENLNKSYNVVRCRAVATSAMREAKNAADLIEAIKSKTQIKIEIISGVEEAALIHQAVAQTVDLSHRNALLLDIGGGSLELTLSSKGSLQETKSFPLGTVRLLQILKSRFLKEKDMRIILGDLLGPVFHFIEDLPQKGRIDLSVGTGGNLECMSTLKKKLLTQERSGTLTLEELSVITEKVEKLTLTERIEKLGLRQDRADVILPALLLTKAVLRYASVPSIHLPGVGLRDGILHSMINKT